MSANRTGGRSTSQPEFGGRKLCTQSSVCEDGGAADSPRVPRIALGQSSMVTVNDDAGSLVILRRSYPDQDADYS